MNNDAVNKIPETLRYGTDLLIALTIMIILCPLILIITILIKISGTGPVIYSQDRIGKNGKPFMIYKFRSMKYDAETGEPMLSGLGQERITRIGRFIRKYRIDEIPNFLNILKGDMTLVGPRPERKFFIDQIEKRVPEIIELQKIKPGITSWGEIKYGYASNVDQMVERLRYDLYYLKHRTLLFDLKIVILTIGTIIRGEGL
jgi:lipopolysaccharide/colanic/teichoic acid biosynthesis glycosyltransferase